MSIRTSSSHPLQIAEIRPFPQMGAVGLTFCPGKKQPLAHTGSWDRDLLLDCDAIRDWGAAAVVSLVEEHELISLQVSGLGEAVRQRHMAWYHLPIRDVSTPGPIFEKSWERVGPVLRFIISNGFSVLVHCKGGLGRAGMIAARLLVELGMDNTIAIDEVRRVRPGAIETSAQARYVMALRGAEGPAPATTPAAIRDRAIGALVGLAVGDAVGTTLEFRARDTYPLLTDMVGGGPFALKPGEWTDDTAMALALADSLLADDRLGEADLMQRFGDWQRQGIYSCTGRCFDIGATVSAAFARWRRTGDPVAGSTEAMSAGNGSLMRLAPVAIRFWRDRDKLKDVAARQSRTTHGASEAVDACVAYALMLADAIAGRRLAEIIAQPEGKFPGAVGSILAGSWRGKPRGAVQSSGYVIHSLEAALWSVARSGGYRGAVLTAANLGGDADTTAAIAGQLAGAGFGMAGIPAAWLDKLAWKERIAATADALLQN